MIFHPDLVDKILLGWKTQTRRPVKPGEPCRYRRGRSYAVQPGRGRRAVCRVRVLRVDRVAVRGIPATDARSEGFQGPPDFYDRWKAMYGSTDGYCWRIEFELA